MPWGWPGSLSCSWGLSQLAAQSVQPKLTALVTIVRSSCGKVFGGQWFCMIITMEHFITPKRNPIPISHPHSPSSQPSTATNVPSPRTCVFWTCHTGSSPGDASTSQRAGPPTPPPLRFPCGAAPEPRTTLEDPTLKLPPEPRLQSLGSVNALPQAPIGHPSPPTVAKFTDARQLGRGSLSRGLQTLAFMATSLWWASTSNQHAGPAQGS